MTRPSSFCCLGIDAGLDVAYLFSAKGKVHHIYCSIPYHLIILPADNTLRAERAQNANTYWKQTMTTRGDDNRLGSPIIISEVTPRSHTRDPVRSLPRHRTTCALIPTTHPYTENYWLTFTMLANIARLIFLRRCLNRKLSWNGLSQNSAHPPPKQNPFPKTQNKFSVFCTYVGSLDLQPHALKGLLGHYLRQWRTKSGNFGSEVTGEYNLVITGFPIYIVQIM